MTKNSNMLLRACYKTSSPTAAMTYLDLASNDICIQDMHCVYGENQAQRDVNTYRDMEERWMISEARYGHVVNTQDHLICRIKPDASILFVNEAFRRYFGWTVSANAQQLSFLDVAAEVDRQGIMDTLQSYQYPGTTGCYVWRAVDGQGRMAWLQWSVKGFYNLSGELTELQLSGRDAGERWKMQQAVKESEAYYRTIFEAMGTAMIIYGDDCVICQANSEFEKLSGYEKREIEKCRAWTDFFRPEDLLYMRHYHRLRSFQPDAVPYRYETNFLDRFGNVKTVLATVAIIPGSEMRVASLVDITENKRNEAALRLSREKFSKAFNSSPSLMIISTLEEGRYIDVNERFCDCTGYSYEEVIGKCCNELSIWTNNEDRQDFIYALRQSGSVRNREIIFQTRSGKRRIGLLSAEILDLTGLECMISIISDITEIKKIEQEMIRFDQLNLVGEIAASIGHEVRNPMTSVRGFLQMMQEADGESGHREYYDLMIDEVDRVINIMNEFLLLARDKKVDLKETNLNDVVGSLSPLIMADAVGQDKSIEMSLADIPYLMLDEKEIRQLIFNLVRNGLESMEAGTILKIKTNIDGSRVVLAVQDEGCGIAVEVLEKLGVPFLTTKDTGTGLGLSVCYSIAARHQAAIKVESSAEGTCFRVCFPIPENSRHEQ